MDHLTEQDAGLLEQAASMLEEHAEEQRNRGNCSAAEGAACSAHAIRRLAPAMLRAGRGCLAQIEEPAQPVAEICSASHDDAQFGERDIKLLRDISGFEYGTPLYAGAAPAAVAPQGEYPHEQMDAMALARYKVVPSHASMLWSHAVVAGHGAQQLYVGREVECQNMARKFAGAFLDGAFAFHSMAAAPTAQAAPALEAPAAPACDLFDCEVRPHPLRYPLAAYHHAPGNGPLHATWQDKPHRIVYDLVAAVRHYAALAASPQAPAAPILGDAERLAAARQDKSLADYWRNRVAGLAEEFTTAEAALYLADRIVADLYDLPQAGVARPAAPASPAVDASPLLAPETELDAVVRDAEQIIRDAEHYRFIKRHRLILSGGTDTFGWPIAPFGDECDRYIAQELATERAAQAKEGGEA